VNRLTPFTRKRAALRAELQAALEQAVQEELQWLWRRVRVKIRTASAQLHKVSFYENHAVWERFEQRLHERLIDLVADGTISLLALEEALAKQSLPGVPFEFDYQTVLNQIEPELAKRIRHVRVTTQRKVASRINQFFATPGETTEAVVRDLSPEFGRPRAANIAQNEITSANSKMQQHVAGVLGVGTWWWQTRRDSLVCTNKLRGPDGALYAGCRELHGKVFNIGQAMPPDGSHIGCRCDAVLILVPPAKGAGGFVR
jgi:hypothetical protein